MTGPWGPALAALASLDAPRPWGVAVSGGGDSMALLHAVARMGGPARAATVDHGLRPEAADEARIVARACAGLNLSHATLPAHLAMGPDLQARARAARYDLLAGWGRRHGLGTVLIAQTAEDVAETLVMRLARGSGIDGLARMRASWTRDGQRFDRPFLDLRRADLRAALRSDGIAWVEDPGNSDPAQERARIRAAITTLGLDAGALARSAARLADARQSLDARAADLARDLIRQDGGDLLIARAHLDRLWRQEPDQARRLTEAALAWIGGPSYPPRGAAIARLREAMRAGRATTLAGCLALPQDDVCRLTREAGRAAPPVPLGQEWDGRWRVTGPQAGAGLTVGVLGADIAATPWRATGRPRRALMGGPAVRRGPDLIAAPLAGLGREWRAEPRVPFHSGPLFR